MVLLLLGVPVLREAKSDQGRLGILYGKVPSKSEDELSPKLFFLC